MPERPASGPPLPFDPVMELLKGGDPALIAQRAGISVDELLQRRDVFHQIQAQRATEEEMALRRVGRNDPCPCGSGRKYKKCCMDKHQEVRTRMRPEDVRLRTEREREKAQRAASIQEGYALLAQREYRKAQMFARRWLVSYPEDDRYHDILASAALYLEDLDSAREIAEARWKAALNEKEFFITHGRHTYDDPGASLGYAYAPEAWLERYWVALRASAYRTAYPEHPDPRILRWIKEIKKSDNLKRFPQQREEGLRVRQEALAGPIQALKEAGPQALPYLLPLCTAYSWSALLVPDILRHWGDDASIRALVDIALFHYPYLSETCLKALEGLGERTLPHLQEAFERDRVFDILKSGLISVAGQIRTPAALEWITTLLVHRIPTIANWAGGVLGQCGYAPALQKIKEANRRIGPEPRLQWAIDELSRLPADRTSSPQNAKDSP